MLADRGPADRLRCCQLANRTGLLAQNLQDRAAPGFGKSSKGITVSHDLP
jgi:hypothetical protein